jgi:hypothetical protein
MGTAHVKIGGNAEVSVLHGTAVGSNTEVGNVEIEITDNATVSSFYGATEAGIKAKSITFNWKSGSFTTRFEWLCSFSSNPELTVEGDTTLNASAAVKADAMYTSIATQFDKIGNVDKDAAYVAPANPNTAKPGDDILKAPTTTKTPAPPATTDPEDTTPDTSGSEKPAETTPVTEKETKPVFTRAPRDEVTTTPGGAQSDTEGGNGMLIGIIAAVAVVAVAAVVVVIVVTKKKKV